MRTGKTCRYPAQADRPISRQMNPKPGRPANPGRTARRARMAAGKIAGHSTSAIARAEGVSRDWAAKELGSSECRQILASLVNGTLERLAQLYNTTLDTIEAGMKAEKGVVANGGKLNLGADHYARLTAAQPFLGVLP